MTLEVISLGSDPAHEKPPVLLIHGAWHGAWCWQGNFLDYFADHGFETHALSLRGHGGSDGRARLNSARARDYVADVEQVVDQIGRPPVLIGHSMGGYVTQKYLERHPAAGGVLLASVPASGTLNFNLEVLRTYPRDWLKVNLTRKVYALMENPDHARYWLFSDQIDDASFAAHHAKLQDEAFPVLIDTLVLDRPKPDRVTTPMAVIGGGNDTIFPPRDIEKTAKAYGVTAKIFEDMPHNLMNDPDWQTVAQWIENWIDGLASRAAA